MYKLLIVDDIKTNRKLLSQLLAIIGDFEIAEACDGQEAVTLFENFSPDLILMDVNMPKMNGYEAASIIKYRCGEEYIPIIFITALSSEASLSESLSSGGDDFISKPFSAEILESKVKAHLRIRELNLQINEKNKDLSELNKKLSNDKKLIEHFFESALEQSFLDKSVIKYHMSSLSTFNGDIFLVERGPEGGLYIVMGDFSGHGLTAAMGTLPVALIFFKMAQSGEKIEDIASELNYELNKLMPVSMFFAATLLELNPQGNTITVWMGGVPELYCLTNEGKLKNTIDSQHMPLGILSENKFNSSTQVFDVETEDKIYLYSDGVTETKNYLGEQFGDERLKNILMNENEDVFTDVLKALNDFSVEGEQNDDITLVELNCQAIPAVKSNVGYITDNTLPWELSIALSIEEIRTTNAIKKLSSILGAMPCLIKYKNTLHILLSEIYSNSIDHSILNLKSSFKKDGRDFLEYYEKRDKALLDLDIASIYFKFNFYIKESHHFLKIQINDSGCGYQKEETKSSDEQLHGRGLEIIRNLCESVEFSEGGQVLTVVYKF